MYYMPNIEIDNAPDTRVLRSKIEGCGLFATKDFAVGEIIVDFRGFDQYWFRIPFKSLDPKQISRNWYIPDGDYCYTCDKSSKFTYINHSREPNCSWHIADKLVKAAREIKKDEELTIDYRLEIRVGRDKFPDWI